MQTRWARLARGSVTASFSLVIAAFSHLSAGGGLPGTTGTLLAIAFAIPVSVALTSPTLSLWRLTVAVFASQAVFHALFSVGGSGASLAVTTGADSGALAHHSMSFAIPFAADASTIHHSGWLMIAAHAVAAVITVIALRRAEVDVWSILRLAVTAAIATILRAPSAPHAAVDARDSTIPRAQTVRYRPLEVLICRMRHRGPPLSALAV